MLLWHFSDGSQAHNVQHMSVKKILQLPRKLVAARLTSQMLQKQAAASLGVCQTVLSAMETGRRTPESLAILTRLAEVYGLDEERSAQLLLAASHDQLISSLRGSLLEPAAELISEAALIHGRLSAEEAAGLIAELRQLAKGKDRSDTLRRTARGLQTNPPGRSPM